MKGTYVSFPLRSYIYKMFGRGKSMMRNYFIKICFVAITVLVIIAMFPGKDVARTKILPLQKSVIAQGKVDLFRITPRISSIPSHSRRLPQALIIGVPYGGTRALQQWMSVSPLFVAPRNPVGFFIDDSLYDRGIQWYIDQMPPTWLNQTTVERNSGYFISDVAAERIWKANPNMKLLIITRDPTKRLVSDYTASLNKYKGPGTYPTFEEMVFYNGTSIINEEWDAVDRSLYYKHLKSWLKFFPKQQFYVVDGDLFLRDPAVVMKGAEKFLGLQNFINRTFFEYDANRGYFCRKYANKTKTCLQDKRTRKLPEISKETLAIVQEFYRTPNKKFFDMIQQWLPYWD